jgi:DNA-directed RNA polymerase specialized sigma24 family protein
MRVSRQWGESSPEAIDELVQETYLKLYADRARFLGRFTATYEDAVFGYIKVFTTNLVHDHFKALKSKKRGGNTLTDSIEGKDPGLLAAGKSSSAAVERRVLIEQIDLCLRRVVSGPACDRDRRIFWLYYRVGLAASAIATIPGIGLGVKGVESTILRLTRQIKAELAARERNRESSNSAAKGIRTAESL